MKAYLIAKISSKGLTHIRRPVQKLQIFEQKSVFSHRAPIEFLGSFSGKNVTGWGTSYVDDSLQKKKESAK
jgi:hypothetical protein